MMREFDTDYTTSLKEAVLEASAYNVLNKLKECSLFCGVYDAKNGNEDFMWGISTVMEVIANYAGDGSFEDMFITNMLESEERQYL